MIIFAFEKIGVSFKMPIVFNDFVSKGTAMGALIRVQFRDGSFGQMVPKALNLFLERGLVSKFKRADGWAVVGKDPLRGRAESKGYSGFERRSYP